MPTPFPTAPIAQKSAPRRHDITDPRIQAKSGGVGDQLGDECAVVGLRSRGGTIWLCRSRSSTSSMRMRTIPEIFTAGMVPSLMRLWMNNGVVFSASASSFLVSIRRLTRGSGASSGPVVKPSSCHAATPLAFTPTSCHRWPANMCRYRRCGPARGLASAAPCLGARVSGAGFRRSAS